MLKCFIDMDGVVADFVGGACKAHDSPNPYEIDPTYRGDDAWGMRDYLGLTPEQFWGPLGYEFWRDLEKTPEADEIIDLCKRLIGKDRLCFLSSPCRTPGCMDGKMEWARMNYPDIPVLLSLSTEGALPPKQFLASPGAILIDDHTPNVRKFHEEGGLALVCPRPWNWAHYLDTMVEIERSLELIVEGN